MVRTNLARTFMAIICSSLLASAQSPPPTPQNLTLPEAVRMALEKNPTVQAAVAYAQAVHEGIAEARAARLPRVDFSEGFTRGNNPVYVFGGIADRTAIHGGRILP